MAGVKNTLGDINNLLAAQLEKLSDDELDSEQLEQEVKRSEAMSKISESIINIATLQYKAWKTGLEYNSGVKNDSITRMLGVRE